MRFSVKVLLEEKSKVVGEQEARVSHLEQRRQVQEQVVRERDVVLVGGGERRTTLVTEGIVDKR